MPLVTTHTSLQELGIPEGLVEGKPIHIAQDRYTREYHTVDPRRFIELASGTWERDPVLSLSYTGAVALVDPPTQSVTHIYDSDETTPDEVRNFDRLAAMEIMRLVEEGRGKA